MKAKYATVMSASGRKLSASRGHILFRGTRDIPSIHTLKGKELR